MPFPFTFTNTAATTAAVTARYVTLVAMSNVALTKAQTTPVWSGAALTSVTHATVATTDTLGIVTIVGVDLAGQVQTEVITPVADSTVYGLIPLRTLTSATISGWVQGGATADNISVGVQAGNIAAAGSGILHGVLVNNVVAATVVIKDASKTIMTIPASQAAGTFYLLDVGFGSALTCLTTNTNDITLVHTGQMPQTWTSV